MDLGRIPPRSRPPKRSHPASGSEAPASKQSRLEATKPFIPRNKKFKNHRTALSNYKVRQAPGKARPDKPGFISLSSVPQQRVQERFFNIDSHEQLYDRLAQQLGDYAVDRVDGHDLAKDLLPREVKTALDGKSSAASLFKPDRIGKTAG